jgi:hypothetical protein
VKQIFEKKYSATSFCVETPTKNEEIQHINPKVITQKFVLQKRSESLDGKIVGLHDRMRYAIKVFILNVQQSMQKLLDLVSRSSQVSLLYFLNSLPPKWNS